ncbi:hypothetical protein PX699_21965 [Sphingobium sp. H39-3-25]|uniref:hypothetical protein n=1 Tax=Sphingobium arseniciresistens TaxID=3030834 RepID=UPI0023B9B76B|nr:hypothetical protein [Sphingobium arseniciresistens]|tara:strand:+ start:33389 stop:33601 length:213 start_codon:yes stop_codon:yes gene_type:complete
MRPQKSAPFEEFTVDVAFFSGSDPFATETYRIPAATWFSAQQQALHMSVNSVYDNARIPDLRRTATVRPA